MLTDLSRVFPAPVGMNRAMLRQTHAYRCVPRTRGDEPATFVNPDLKGKCSPHPWG